MGKEELFKGFHEMSSNSIEMSEIRRPGNVEIDETVDFSLSSSTTPLLQSTKRNYHTIESPTQSTHTSHYTTSNQTNVNMPLSDNSGTL